MGWALDFNPFENDRKKNINTSRTREKIKMIHMLAKREAKGVSKDRSEKADARRSSIKSLVSGHMTRINELVGAFSVQSF